MVTPHGVERDADLVWHSNDLAVLGPGRTQRSWRRKRRHRPATNNGSARRTQLAFSRPSALSFNAASAANGPGSGLTSCGGLEHRARLARIGIEPEDEEFGRHRAEIDDAVDERLRPVPAPLRPFGASSSASSSPACARRTAAAARTARSTVLFDLVDERLERDHAVLPDRRRHRARDMQSAGAVPRHVEAALRAAASRASPPAAATAARDVAVGHEIEMPAGLGHVLERDRNAARVPALACLLSFAHVDVRVIRDKGLGAGKGDLAAQRARRSSWASSLVDRRAHIARQVARLRASVACRKDIARQRLLKDPLVRRVKRRQIGGLPAVEGFGKAPASASAPQGRRPPFRADCRRDRGKTRRTSSCPRPAVRPSGRAARRAGCSTSTRCSTIMSNRPSTVSGTR